MSAASAPPWGFSSVGRALPLQGRCQRFESANLHMPCYLYILRSLKDQRLYTGICADVGDRFRYHNHGGSASTKHRRPFELLYVEEFPDRSAAALRERQLKSL